MKYNPIADHNEDRTFQVKWISLFSLNSDSKIIDVILGEIASSGECLNEQSSLSNINGLRKLIYSLMRMVMNSHDLPRVDLENYSSYEGSSMLADLKLKLNNHNIKIPHLASVSSMESLIFACLKHNLTPPELSLIEHEVNDYHNKLAINCALMQSWLIDLKRELILRKVAIDAVGKYVDLFLNGLLLFITVALPMMLTDIFGKHPKM